MPDSHDSSPKFLTLNLLPSLAVAALAAQADVSGSPRSSGGVARAHGHPAQSAQRSLGEASLTELGIDFGAGELGRLADLDLTDAQKRRAFEVMRRCKPRIERLCSRMTRALRMPESRLNEKRAKEAELATLLREFRKLQKEIVAGLREVARDARGDEDRKDRGHPQPHSSDQHDGAGNGAQGP